MRWSSNRISDNGVIRGKTKEQSVLEGGNIFDIMTGVTIILLIKKLNNTGKGQLHYLDIGNNLNKYQKLEKLKKWKGLSGAESEFQSITPNEKGDWINQRNSNFDELIPLGDKKTQNALFIDYTGGITTGRDGWSWNFSQSQVEVTMKKSIDYYNQYLGDTKIYKENVPDISWTRSLKQRFERRESQSWQGDRMYLGMYRPFTKKHVYYAQAWIDRQYQMSKVLPISTASNLMISLSNKTGGKQFSTLMVDVLPDRNIFAGGSQNLPKYIYHITNDSSFFDVDEKYSAIRPEMLRKLSNLSEEDAIYYVYGVFHSAQYGKLYYEDLAKSFPKIPNVKHKEKYIEIGKELADLHLNYENVPAYDDVNIIFKSDNPTFKVKKMKHPKRGQLDTIIFNEDIVITDIPERAYEYVVNGKPAIEWIIDQYQVKRDKKSGIVDDPNEFSENPKYIFNLLLSIINVSMKTMDLVESLPPLEIID